jgi:glycosyltransferase involved in cell wall biosynthesis
MAEVGRASSRSPFSVAIPVRNGAADLPAVLDAIRAQRVDGELEIVVVDSGSTDGSVSLCEGAGARVERIAPEAFSHGGTRNRLMELARGEHVAFLTQDAVPAHDGWLAVLMTGFADDGVGLVCGPYLPRSDASPMVRRELEEWFATIPPLARGPVGERPPPGPHTFFSSANGAVSRAAWERVPFRQVPYAEDQRLAVDMLNAGFAKAYEARAGVVHSHDYPPLERFRRWFDEFRALREVYGYRAPLAPRPVLGTIRHEVARDRAVAGDAVVWESLCYHTLRALGAGLGTRADRLPVGVRRLFSLERRPTYEPSHP